MTQTEAAREMNVSRRTTQHACTVLWSGHQDLIDAVADGRMKVSVAAAEVRRRQNNGSRDPLFSGDACANLRRRVYAQLQVYRREAEAVGDSALAEALGILTGQEVTR